MTMCPRAGEPRPALSESRIDPPHEPPVEVGGGVVYCTFSQWVYIGREMARRHTRATAVSITDRTPLEMQIEVRTGLDLAHVHYLGRRPSPRQIGTGYGWMYGWRWTDPTMECSRYTLSEEIFRALPSCPYAAIRRLRATGSGVAPRWPGSDAALAALNTAAWRWATGWGREQPSD